MEHTIQGPVRGALVAFSLLLACSLGARAGEVQDPGVEARAKIMRERILQHFNLGISAPIEWLNETRQRNGCRWDFRAQYFSGGAAKQKSWDSVFLHPWNKWVNPKKVRGVWAEKFIQSSLENGYLPWITFYNLAQSNPANYKPGPAKATPVNAKVTATMKSYWKQVKLLMQLCAKHRPRPIVVQVEPDEWGHLLLSTRKGKFLDPATVNVKVGSTGLPELKGLPDNLAGYAQAWLRLRAKYAPYNVLLATNPSAWDWRGSMSAGNWVRIFKACGMVGGGGAGGGGGFELSVLEFGDRDLGCHGKGPPYREADFVTRFQAWDKMLAWIATLHKGTGLWVVMWQVAVGNTYFRTCNQSDGHYCDGIVQGLLEGYPKNPLAGRFVQAGCAGFVFNPGQGIQTHVYDYKKDGITNPDPIPGNLGHTSKYADDDGGYLRLRAGAYYKSPFKILGKPGPATAASTGSSKKKTPRAKPKPKPKLKVDPKVLAEWDIKLRGKLAEALKSGKRIRAYLRLFGPKDREKPYLVKGADASALKVKVQGSVMPVAWAKLPLRVRANLAKALLDALGEQPGTLLLAAVYFAADGRLDTAGECFAKAALKDPTAAKAAQAAVGWKGR